MRRRAVLLLVAMAATLIVASGVALAATIVGTSFADQPLEGTEQSDTIRALAGNDAVYAYGSKDRVFGDEGNDLLDGFGGNDVIYGGPDNDGDTGDAFNGLNLEGAEGSDVVYGEDGDDFIDAANNDTSGSRDRSIGGAGNDTINAADGNKDVINCGTGAGDLVVLDELDTQRNCESLQAP